LLRAAPIDLLSTVPLTVPSGMTMAKSSVMFGEIDGCGRSGLAAQPFQSEI